MPKLIINADDFGLTPGLNAGILYLFQNHSISSTTILSNADYFDHALEIYSQYSLNVGVHLVITAGKPLTKAKTLIDQNGNFLKVKNYNVENMLSEMVQEIEKEWSAQIQKAIEAGIRVTHLDVHHHMYLKYSPLHEVIFRLARKYHLPIRIDRNYIREVPEDICSSDYFVPDFDHMVQKYKQDPERLNMYLENMFTQIAEHEISELMVHPAFVDYTLCQVSSMNLSRMDTLNILASEQFHDLMEKYHIELISYKDLNKKG